MQPCLSSSSSSNGLHTGQRVLTPASTSSSSSLPAWRYPAPRHHSSSSQHHRPQQQQQQQCHSSPEDSQAFRFKHKFNPQQLSPDLGSSSSFGWPLKDGQRATVAGEAVRLDPEQTFWSSTGPQDAVQLRNPWASKFRVKRVPMPVPVSLPGSEYWHVEMLNNYSTNWPSLKFVDGKLQFRKGFLEPFDDPKVVPFFFYRGLERLTYTWSDRAFQALFTVLYAGAHLALFSWFWQSSPPLAVAVGLNWGLGKLSLAKWGILLFLACTDRMWLYFLYLAGAAVDRMLATLFPPVRNFFWAMFTGWLVFVAVTPTYFYPLPFAPFAPGTLGAAEAIA